MTTEKTRTAIGDLVAALRLELLSNLRSKRTPATQAARERSASGKSSPWYAVRRRCEWIGGKLRP